MKYLLFIAVTAVLCQTVIGDPYRRHNIFGSKEDFFMHHPWRRDGHQHDKPHSHHHNGFFGSSEGSRESSEGSRESSVGSTESSEGSRESSVGSRESSEEDTPSPGNGYGNKGGWQHGGFGNNWGNRRPTTEKPTPKPNPLSSETGVTSEDMILACIKSCPVTTEYNPVCGSNNVTYANPGRLDCEERCGVAVKLSKLTACSVSETINTGRNKTREEMVACIRQCPVTAEYNPVCGSNNMTYANPGRLECEQNCGMPIIMVKLTACEADLSITPNIPSKDDLIAGCIRTCPVTGEFNPVCGSNNETYSNPGRLECAQNCGTNVYKTRETSCDAPPTEEEIRNASPLNIPNTTIPQPFTNENEGNNSDGEYNVNNQNNNGENNAATNVKGGNDKSGGNNDGKEIIFNRGTDGNNAGNNFNGENNRNPINQEKAGPGSSSNGGNNVYGGNQFSGGQGGNIGNNANYPGNYCNGINSSNNKRTPTVRELMGCMQLCVLTSESNPVCGTDDITYMNPGRLLCAQFCGIDVRMKKFAACSSTSTCNCNNCPAPCTNHPVTNNPGEVTPPPNTLKACLHACPTTHVSKPVCGTNNVTYKNIENLICARQCGVDVSLLKESHCSAPGPNPTDNNPPVWSNTEKPTLQDCIQKCTVQQTYKPICGTDNVTYNNTGHLICARQCGLDVRVKIQSPCSSISPSTEKAHVTPGQSGFNFTFSPDVIDSIWTTTPEDDENFDLDQRFQDGK